MAVKDLTRWLHVGDGVYVRNLGQSEPEVRATKTALEAAKELGVDLTTVEGSGKEGRITKADVEAAADA